MLLVEAQGAPWEIGFGVGSAVPELVQQTVELVCRFDFAASELRRRLAPIERRLAETMPDVLAEAQGIAEGAGVEQRDALALSVASDLHGRLPGWCSLSAVPSRSGLLVGKNLDTSRELAAVQILERLSPDGGLAFLHLTAAGAMWTDGGLNEAGLALVNASLDSSSSDPDGLPDGILARELLARCEDVPAAISLATKHTMRTLGENIIVADAAGRAAVIEKLPGGQAVREADSVVACNHVIAPHLTRLMAEASPIRGNSERRLARLNALAAAGSEWTIDGLGAVLADHGGGVCQHGDEDLWTVAALVLSPATRQMWVADGPPCRTAFELVGVEVGGEKEVRDVRSR